MCLRAPPPPTSLVAMPHASRPPLRIMAAGGRPRTRRPSLPALLQGAHRLHRQRDRPGDGQPRSAPSSSCWRPRTPTRTSRSTSTRPGARSPTASPSTTPCSTSARDVRRSASGLAASMGQFLLCAGAPGKRYALPALAHPDAPALGRHAGPGGRHRHPGRADHLPEADDGRAHRLPHRPAARAHRDRLGPRPLVHRRRGLEYGFIDQVIDRSTATAAAGTRRGSGRPGLPSSGRCRPGAPKDGRRGAEWRTRRPMAAEAAGAQRTSGAWAQGHPHRHADHQRAQAPRGDLAAPASCSSTWSAPKSRSSTRTRSSGWCGR